MRREFEMTEEDLQELLQACKPVPYIIVGGAEPRSQQQNANDAWARLGRKMGFEAMSAKPCPSKGDRFFTAEEVQEEEESNA